MSYQALATDYDGTIATEGKVKQTTITALKRWQETGRKLIMVSLDALKFLGCICFHKAFTALIMQCKCV
ncbi:MAG: hypothetical protein QNJ18_20330 [Xenococcaceae cyanobacterium MO_167.B52]|nr:hypothetical protein [Xenococcaceae cyanobacterium MO_167.B52]